MLPPWGTGNARANVLDLGPELRALARARRIRFVARAPQRVRRADRARGIAKEVGGFVLDALLNAVPIVLKEAGR